MPSTHKNSKCCKEKKTQRKWLCLLVMCSMEELPPSPTVLGNFGISWTAGVMDCVLCALNSEIMNFSRFAPRQLPVLRKGQGGCWCCQACDISPADWLPVTSFYYSASCLRFSFPLPGTSGPHTAPGSRGERGSVSEPPSPARSPEQPEENRPLWLFWSWERQRCWEANQGSWAYSES